MRQQDGVSLDVIKKSLDITKNKQKYKRAATDHSKTDKSQILFITHDYKFVIKNMPEAELDSFMLYRDYYFDHLKLNDDSLMQRVYGIYQIQIKGMNPLNFIFMEKRRFLTNK